MASETDKKNNGAVDNHFWIKVGVVIITTTVIAGILFYATQRYVIKQAEDKIQDLLLAHKGIFFQHFSAVMAIFKGRFILHGV